MPHEAESIPQGLPVGGYLVTEETEIAHELTVLENQAHAQKVLLSSDAMRFFIAKVNVIEERTSVLDTVLAKARVTFPSEDGWVVLNLARMEGLLEEVNEEHDALVSDESVDIDFGNVPVTGGSLAEAILDTNIAAAYQLIALRPMLALADAATDLDALYRSTKGESVVVSDMLKTQGEHLSQTQLQEAISALTSALDGTYTDEAAAVKMAIMKAIKAVS